MCPDGDVRQVAQRGTMPRLLELRIAEHWPRLHRQPGDACPFLTLPLGAKGSPGQELKKLIDDAKAGAVSGCSRFLEVLDIYEARNLIVHQGRYRPTIFEPGLDTSFIELALMRPAVTWFSGHLAADLKGLDKEIASQQVAPGQRAARP